MDVYIESLGCARNQVDSEMMRARLEAAGWRVADEPAEADAIVVNTCSFIETAADESIDTILALAEYKRTGRCRRLIVAGCLPQRYGAASVASLPEVDLFLGTGAYDRIVDALGDVRPPEICLLPDPEAIDILDAAGRKPTLGHAAYLKIAEGCSRRCTYCVIPRLRGRHRSRTQEVILAEARTLIASGVREITLVAQETTAYGTDLEPPATLARLLGGLASLDRTVWIRCLYGHPESITPEVWRTVADHPNLCPYFDIPIQHVAGAVLRRMGRHYSAEALTELFAAIREVLPEAALRTTLLVGFPGEREEDLRKLLDFIERVQFDHLGVFTYSDADDLPAHRLERHIGSKTAAKRLDRVMALQREISDRKLARLMDRRMTVLVEKQAEPGIYAARSMYQAPEVDGVTLIRTDRTLRSGDFVTVRIVDTLEYDLIAEPI
jgi:ribosomal protein S12 methylthiotransferase